MDELAESVLTAIMNPDMFNHMSGDRVQRKPSGAIDGRSILYHYLQKDLFESDIWLFQMLCARLVAGLGIWLHPELYRRMPIILPFALRDPSCRRRKEGDIESWGSPTENGYLRDDNSLVKAIPRAMTIMSARQTLYDGRRIGTGFVAAHVWRQIRNSSIGASLSSRDPWINTFVPNLVWLPTEVAKLSDREGTFTQMYLQALSAKIYRHVDVPDKLRPLVDRVWRMLDVPTGIPEQGLPELEELSFFHAGEEFIRKRRQAINCVVDACRTILSGEPLTAKVVTSRYSQGLASVSRDELSRRVEELTDYLTAISIQGTPDDSGNDLNYRGNGDDG